MAPADAWKVHSAAFGVLWVANDLPTAELLRTEFGLEVFTVGQALELEASPRELWGPVRASGDAHSSHLPQQAQACPHVEHDGREP